MRAILLICTVFVLCSLLVYAATHEHMSYSGSHYHLSHSGKCVVVSDTLHYTSNDVSLSVDELQCLATLSDLHIIVVH